MLRRRCLLTLVLLLASASAATAEPPPVELVDAFPGLGLVAPSDIQDPGDGSGRLFAVEVPGRIIGFENDPDGVGGTVFLDLSSRVAPRGMNGLAFHPDHADNGYVYVSYMVDGPYRSVVSRFSVHPDDPDRVDADSELILLEELEVGLLIHVVHRLVFGPDGYLYIGSGDNLPASGAQDLGSLQGKVLRIDVDHPAGGEPYGIPASNPFAGNADGHREEIYAYGLRNPWEFSFDESGRLWLGDVGDRLREEIDLVVKGGNYGWPIFEGKRCNRTQAECDSADTIFPVWDYEHGFDEQEGFSVIGGEVYQGASCPAVRGKYVYADFMSRNVWALTVDAFGNPDHELLLAQGPAFFSASGRDADGELLITGYNTGQIFKLHCAAMQVAIDVAPNREPNVVLGRGRGFTAVALLGADAFDVSDVDVATLAFGPNGASPAWGWGGFLWDVNRDGFTDRVTFYLNRKTGLEPGDIEACLTGETAEARFEGCDEVVVKPPRRPRWRRHGRRR